MYMSSLFTATRYSLLPQILTITCFYYKNMFLKRKYQKWQATFPQQVSTFNCSTTSQGRGSGNASSSSSLTKCLLQMYLFWLTSCLISWKRTSIRPHLSNHLWHLLQWSHRAVCCGVKFVINFLTFRHALGNGVNVYAEESAFPGTFLHKPKMQYFRENLLEDLELSADICAQSNSNRHNGLLICQNLNELLSFLFY